MVEPKKAAACIIMDPEGRILMVRRSPELRFMPGHHAFPGGGVNDSESTDFVVGADDPHLARAIKAAAREVFEETGLLLARGSETDADKRRRARVDLLEKRATFNDILSEFQAEIEAERFENAGKWITPGFSPIRFDTHYFLYRHESGEDAELIEGELVGLDWLHPAEVRERWHLGEIRVSTPVACTLHPLAARTYPDFLPILQRPTDRYPGHPGRYELRRGIHVVPIETRTIPPATHTNCLLIGEEEFVLFDPGADAPEEMEHLESQIEHLRDLGGELSAIVITHSHPDHIAGVDRIRERYGAPVWAHEATDAQVDIVIDRYLEDEEVVELPGRPGWRLRVMHTPGHDPGHIAVYEETTRTILCGDMIANPGTIVVSEQYGGDMNQFIASLERLMTLEDAKLVVPAHGMPQPQPADVFAKHREHRLWRENKIREAYERGAQTLEALLATAYDDAPEEARLLAEHSLRAHLTRLGLSLAE